MPVLLCLAALPLLFTLFWQAKDRPDRPARAWDEAFLLAATFWAAIAISLAELLSAFEAVAFGPLAAAWAAVDAILFGVAWAVWRSRRPRVTFHRPDLTRLDLLLLAILGVYALALAAVAWAAPPNNVDSLQYHMARVVHWAQQGSLAHYGASYGPQLWFPPGAEIVILNLRLLVRDDRLANLVQWFAYFASLVGVWWIGRLFALGRPARWVAIGFAASIPMAVLQSTSTQNDMVVALWLVVLAGLVASARRRSLTRVETGALGTVLGLGLLSKATFYFYCAPFVLWMVMSRPWRTHLRGSLQALLTVAALAILLNGGHVWRNIVQTWTPVGPIGNLPVQTYPPSLGPAVVTVLLRPLQAGLLNFVTPSPKLNDTMGEGFAALQSILGVRMERPLLIWDWNHEEVAGSPIHFLLLLASGACLILQRRWPKESLAHAACLVAGFALLPVMTANAIDPVTIRFQLPILVAWSPLIGLVLGRTRRTRTLGASAVILLLSALPWVLFNKSRPIIAMRPDPGPGELPCLAGCTAIGSVFSTPKADVLLANRRENLESYLGLSESLQAHSCRDVGLRIESYDPEYAWWYLLDAPQSGFHLETIYTTPDLEPLLDRDFRPCAIICTICGGRMRLHGLDLYSGWGDVRLYLGDGFTWDEDG
jgi:hypothetical protein